MPKDKHSKPRTKKPKHNKQRLPNPIPDKLHQPHSHLKSWKTKWPRSIAALFVAILFGVLYFFWFSKPIDDSFSCDIVIDKNLLIKTYSRSVPVNSPLFATFYDTVRHSGNLVYAREYSLQRFGETSETNFLITTSTRSVIPPFADYSFSAVFYKIPKTSLYQISPQRFLDNFFNKRENIALRIPMSNIPFLSIINNNINVYTLGDGLSAGAYIPVNESALSFAIARDNHTKEVHEITLQNEYNTKHSNYVPSLDILGDSLAIIWEGAAELLGEYGHVFPRGLDAHDLNARTDLVNVLVINSLYHSKISFLPWDKRLYNLWQDEYLFKFNEPQFQYVRFVDDFPLLMFSGDPEDAKAVMNNLSNIALLNPTQDTNFLSNFLSKPKTLTIQVENGLLKILSPLDYPHLRYEVPNKGVDAGKIEISIKDFVNNEEYNYFKNLSQPIGGVWKIGGQGAFMNAQRVDILDPSSILDSLVTVTAITQSEIKAQSSKVINESKILNKTTSTESEQIDINGISLFFKYPPLVEENSLLIYEYFTDAVMSGGSSGTVRINNQDYSISDKDTLEIKDITNFRGFDYPTMVINTNEKNSNGFSFKGTGKIVLNGEILNRTKLQIITDSMLWGLAFFVFSISGITLKDILLKKSNK